MKKYKEITVVFSGALERILVNELNVLKVVKYTIISGVKVSWTESVKHLNTHVWPGTDDVLVIVMEEDKVGDLIEVLEILKENLDYDTKFTISVKSLEYYSE
jgi:hypothetical protein